jgi:hypothetical protein
MSPESANTIETLSDLAAQLQKEMYEVIDQELDLSKSLMGQHLLPPPSEETSMTLDLRASHITTWISTLKLQSKPQKWTNLFGGDESLSQEARKIVDESLADDKTQQTLRLLDLFLCTSSVVPRQPSFSTLTSTENLSTQLPALLAELRNPESKLLSDEEMSRLATISPDRTQMSYRHQLFTRFLGTDQTDGPGTHDMKNAIQTICYPDSE